MQEHTFQDAGSLEKDAGSHPIPMMQAKTKTTLAYPSRCRFSAKNSTLTSSLDAGSKDVTPIVVAMLWSNHYNHLQPIYKTEEIEQKNSEYIQ